MWDAGADGYARGEGLAVVVLKTLPQALADNDHIECIIRESGVNQDGRTVGLTVPSATAQAELIRSTYARCGLDPTQPQDRCQYFEAHGTGTAGGDPKEAQAIRDVFFPPRSDGDSDETGGKATAIGDGDDQNDQRLYVGSVKTVIGHTEGAAGLSGVLKASLALQNAQIPSNMHFEQLSPSVKPFYYPHLQVPTELLPWPISAPGVPRRASINSFGFGGTNAHVIIESWDGGTSAYDGDNHGSAAENIVKPSQHNFSKTCGPFILSAHSRTALTEGVSALSKTLKDASDSIDLEDLAWTLQSRRTEFPFRATFSAGSKYELVDKLDAFKAEGCDASGTISVSPKFPLRVLGVFTGQGAQWHRMGAGLFEQSPVFRGMIRQLDDSLASLPDAPSWSLADIMVASGNESRVHEAEFAQPLTTALQIALVDLLRSVGVALDAVVGHSSGEIAAAYASGYLLASDAIRVAYYRGLHSSRARSPVSGQLGSMLAVGMALNDATSFCQRSDFLGKITVAAHNSPSSVTLSGDSDAILKAKALLDQQETFARVLQVNKAYHSHHMQPCAESYLESMKQCMIQPLRTCLGGECSWYSSVYGPDGRSIHDPDALSDRYWIENMVKPVLFHHAVERAVREEDHCFDLALEIGPHPTLQRPVTDTLRAVTGVDIPYLGVLSRGEIDTVAFSDALGFIWTRVRTPLDAPSIISWQALRKALYGDDELRQPRLLKNLPSYSWDHEKPLLFESSISNAWRISSRTM
jgi:acyl transferase domain-containing protein